MKINAPWKWIYGADYRGIDCIEIIDSANFVIARLPAQFARLAQIMTKAPETLAASEALVSLCSNFEPSMWAKDDFDTYVKAKTANSIARMP